MGEMLFSTVLTLRNVGEVILLFFASNITSLALIIVSVVNLAEHCMLASWCQLDLASMPLTRKKKKKIFMAFCYG